MSGLLPRKYKNTRRYSFQRTFGTTTQLVDIDLDKNQWNPNQNLPERIFGNPPIPNGCSYYTRADIAANEDGVLYNPAFVGEKACLIEDVPYGSPLPLEASFKAGITYGLLAFGETTDEQALAHRRGPYFEVHPVSGQDYFDALWNALCTGRRPVSVGTQWFGALEVGNIDNFVPSQTNDWHNWEACGVVTTDQPRIKVKWWGGAPVYFNRATINNLMAVKGTDALTDVDGKATPQDIQTVKLNIIETLISYLQRLLALYQANLKAGALEVIQGIMTPQDELYSQAKLALGTHKTLNPNVPSELGCAEAWSTIAKLAGVQGIPAEGFAGTAALDQWLSTNNQFQTILTPEPGATIISPTVGNNHGHVGIFGQYDLQYKKDWGIVSNDSNTGIVREQWSYNEWRDYYRIALGLTVHIYRRVA